MTPEQEAVLRDIQIQLRGPGLSGWPELGTDAAGHQRGLIEAMASALTRIGELTDESAKLHAQVGELRTEISELEATTADLTAQVERANERRLPWPFSLIEGPAALFAEQLEALVEALLPDLPGIPGAARTLNLESTDATLDAEKKSPGSTRG